MLLLVVSCMIIIGNGSWGLIVTQEGALYLRLSYGGILYGLLFLLNKGFRRVAIQSDNLEVVRVLHDGAIADSGITVLRRVQRVMRTEGKWRIRYVLRENNLVTDCQAKLSLVWRSSRQVFKDAPNEVLEFLQEDKASGALTQFNLT